VIHVDVRMALRTEYHHWSLGRDGFKKTHSLPLDVHLMIEEPERYLEAFAEAGAPGDVPC